MHSNQLTLSTINVRNMISIQFPQYAKEDVKSLRSSTGTVNSIFRIGEVASARFALQQQRDKECHFRSLQSESTAMIEFADSCYFPSPRPIGIGQPSDSYPLPWMLQTWITGETCTSKGLASSRVFASDIAQLITSLRAVEVKGRHFVGQNRGGRLTDHDAWMATCFNKSEALLDVPRLRALWNSFRDLPPSETPNTMSHGDLTPMNVLAREEKIVGILDTGSFGPADSALDLVAVWHMLEKEQREVIKDTLDLGDVEWRRGAAWAFEQAMGWVWYYQHSNPILAASGKITLQRILEDDEVTSLV